MIGGLGGLSGTGPTAFGAAKTGTGFDPINFVTRPQVILRFICWLSSVIVFGCISAKGWTEKGKCLYNKDGSACRFGSILGIIGFLASIAFLALEAFFQNISSIKMRRRAVIADLGFSGAWAALYLICFAYLGIAWSKSDYPHLGEGINNARAAIAFSFFSVFAWAGCAYLAYQRYLQGADMGQFATDFDTGELGAGYSTYTGDMNEPAYQEAPFSSVENQMQSGMNYQAPAY